MDLTAQIWRSQPPNRCTQPLKCLRKYKIVQLEFKHIEAQDLKLSGCLS